MERASQTCRARARPPGLPHAFRADSCSAFPGSVSQDRWRPRDGGVCLLLPVGAASSSPGWFLQGPEYLLRERVDTRAVPDSVGLSGQEASSPGDPHPGPAWPGTPRSRPPRRVPRRSRRCWRRWVGSRLACVSRGSRPSRASWGALAVASGSELLPSCVVYSPPRSLYKESCMMVFSPAQEVFIFFLRQVYHFFYT